MKSRLFFLFVVGFLCVPVASFAKQASHAGFSKTVDAGGTSLVLNGVGMREATVLKIDVYRGALYLKTASKNAASILKRDEPWRIEMKFVRDVGRGKLEDAWKEGFAENAPGRGAAGLRRLTAWMVDIKKGQSMAFTYVPGRGTAVEVAGKTKGVIKGSGFAKALLSVWLGPNPPNQGLKSGMLGR